MAQERDDNGPAWEWIFERISRMLPQHDNMLSSDKPADVLGNRITRCWLTTYGLPRNASDTRLMVEFVMLVMLAAEDADRIRLQPKYERN